MAGSVGYRCARSLQALYGREVSGDLLAADTAGSAAYVRILLGLSWPGKTNADVRKALSTSRFKLEGARFYFGVGNIYLQVAEAFEISEAHYSLQTQWLQERA